MSSIEFGYLGDSFYIDALSGGAERGDGSARSGKITL
jgi:hypothetical protein